MLPSNEAGSELDALKFSLASEIVELVVLTGDEAFLQTLRDAVGGARRLWHVPSADKVSDLLVAGGVGIVVLDVDALYEPAGIFVGQIKHQFPDLVVVVAGHRDAENSLAALISAGIVYRFIHKPVSPARAKLFAEAAVKKYEVQRRRAAATPPVRTASRTGQVWLIGGGAGVLGFALIAIWAIRGGQSEAPARRAANTPPVGGNTGVSQAQVSLLSRAAAALTANHLTDPPGSSALELYLQANARDPADPAARAGLVEVRERLLARAENALLEERLDEAAAAIETARKSGVEGGRIAFLSAQLTKSRSQVKNAQASARLKSDADSQPVQPDRVTPLLDQAVQRMNDGRLMDPERDSAKFYVTAALGIDSANAAALKVKGALAAALLTQAHSAIDRRDFPRAGAWIEGAEGIAAPANIDSARTLLTNARHLADADAWEALLRNADERLRQDRLIEPANDNAKYYLETLRRLDPNNAGLAPAIQDLGGRLVAKARRTLDLQQFPAAESWLDAAAEIGFVSAESSAVRHDLDAAVAKQTSLTDIVPAGQLSVLKTVQPNYPPKAQRNKTEGWVELDFVVGEAGQVRDIGVHGANNPGVFEDAAIEAVGQWRYKPVVRDGKPVAVHTRVRIRFTLP